MKCWIAELGVIDYQSALDLQAHLVSLRRDSKIPDVLLLLEHTHTYTVGRRANPSNLLLSEGEMARRGIAYFPVDRGGEITYHGPGQLVGYPILKVDGISRIRGYLRDLEDILIRTASDFGVRTGRTPGYPGTWLGSKKVAAIGLRVSGGVSKHGFALNVSTDLSYFKGIIPCGLHDKGVTSLSEILGRNLPLDVVRESLIRNFSAVLSLDTVSVPRDSILELCLRNRSKSIA